MANAGNLRPPFSPSEAREYGRKGALASAEARRARRDMRETFRALLDMPLRPGDLDEVRSMAGASKKNVTVGEAIALVMANRALKGDVRAAEFVRDTSGQRPASAVEATVTSHDAAEAFSALLAAEEASCGQGGGDGG